MGETIFALQTLISDEKMKSDDFIELQRKSICISFCLGIHSMQSLILRVGSRGSARDCMPYRPDDQNDDVMYSVSHGLHSGVKVWL